jgi:hypothetical protein
VNLDGADLLVFVDDANPEGPVRTERPDDAESGRGLGLVEALSKAWGWTRTAGGKRVWARL